MWEPVLFFLFVSFQGVEELTPGIKMLLKLFFKICPYVQCGLIIALIVAGLSLVGSVLLSCYWLPISTVALKKQKQTRKFNVLLLETPVNTNNATNKTNVCIVPLRPTSQANPNAKLPLETPTLAGDEKVLMMLLPPQVDQQKCKLKQNQLKDKFYNEHSSSTRLPSFLQHKFGPTK